MKLRIQPISGVFLVLRCRKLGARLALQDPKDDEIRLPAKAESGVFVIAGWFTPVRCEAAGRLLVRLRCR